MNWARPICVAIIGSIAACADDGSSRPGNDEVGGISDFGDFDDEGSDVEGSNESSTGATGDAETEGVDIKFDLGEVPDVGTPDCSGSGGGSPFSNIWISNSLQGTVSKIDTINAIEVARYSAGPELPDPSRTSVNLLGDVAVADRNGGIIKIAARLSDCVDNNDDGVIQTSTGPEDVLPWGQDECVLWHLPLPASGNRGPRPVAWEGKFDEDSCVYEQPRVWVGHADMLVSKGVFYRLDGGTGAILDYTTHPWSHNNWGPYGGAVDAEADFWVLGWNSGPLVEIDSETLAIQEWATPDDHFMYGMTVDAQGDVWVAGANAYHRFDPDTETWTSGAAGQSMRGVAAHPDGYMWIADPGGVVKVDMLTGELAADITLQGVSSPVGTSVDVEGFVWLVDQAASKAIKLDPDTHEIVAEVLGLVSPYTYSDMTGGGLSLVVGVPQG